MKNKISQKSAFLILILFSVFCYIVTQMLSYSFEEKRIIQIVKQEIRNAQLDLAIKQMN